MPTYDYLCAGCGHSLELFQSMREAPKKKCPACGKQRLQRQIGTGAGFIFKGSGFYLTDYRSDSYKQAQQAAEGGGTASPAASGGPAPAKPADGAPDGAGKQPAVADSQRAGSGTEAASPPAAPKPEKKPAPDGKGDANSKRKRQG